MVVDQADDGLPSITVLCVEDMASGDRTANLPELCIGGDLAAILCRSRFHRDAKGRGALAPQLVNESEQKSPNWDSHWLDGM